MKKQKQNAVRMIEFFSGIGGMRCAIKRILKESYPLHCHAFDISIEANNVYRHNSFSRVSASPQKRSRSGKTISEKEGTVSTKLVEQLGPGDLPPSDIWTMYVVGQLLRNVM